jgi:hypothetical protein
MFYHKSVSRRLDCVGCMKMQQEAEMLADVKATDFFRPNQICDHSG